MRKLALGAALAASFVLSGSALAQSFTYDVTWGPVDSVGGLTGPNGTQYAGGSVSGNYATTFGNGSVVNGTVRCAGTGQPPGSIFAIHLACTAKDEQGTYSLAYGCNFIGEPGPETPLGCVGAMEAKEGESKGRRGGLTMYWYSDENSTGTGQWYVSQ